MLKSVILATVAASLMVCAGTTSALAKPKAVEKLPIVIDRYHIPTYIPQTKLMERVVRGDVNVLLNHLTPGETVRETVKVGDVDVTLKARENENGAEFLSETQRLMVVRPPIVIGHPLPVDPPAPVSGPIVPGSGCKPSAGTVCPG